MREGRADEMMTMDGREVIWCSVSLAGLVMLTVRKYHYHPAVICSVRNAYGDWLKLLGFDIQLVSEYFYQPPVKNASLLKKLEFMEVAGQGFAPITGRRLLNGGYQTGFHINAPYLKNGSLPRLLLVQIPLNRQF